MNIKEIAITNLREYENNPRNNDSAVDAVAESIREFGFKVPIVIMGITQVCLKVGYEIVIVPLTTYITKKVAAKEEMNT